MSINHVIYRMAKLKKNRITCMREMDSDHHTHVRVRARTHAVLLLLAGSAQPTLKTQQRTQILKLK